MKTLSLTLALLVSLALGAFAAEKPAGSKKLLHVVFFKSRKAAITASICSGFASGLNLKATT